MVRVCDAIMGNGKTESSITYMNEHADRKYIYITPYLEEAARIRESCPQLHFIEPSDNIREYDFKKCNHTIALIEEGRNIATTHQSFKRYTPSTLEKIREHGYTLIIDENVDVLEKIDVNSDDVQIAVEAGYIVYDNGAYRLTGKDYSGSMYRNLFNTMRARELVRIEDTTDTAFFYWMISPALITAFREVFILTYLFEGQSLHHLLEIYNIPYERIGIHRDEDGTFRFGEYPGYTPEYVKHLKEKIHILDNTKMNEIGDDYYAMSKNWFTAGGENVVQLKRNLANCFKHVFGDTPAEDRLWGSFNDAFHVMKGKGYTKNFLTFNAKSTNKYRNCRALAYITNIFMNTAERRFYASHGIDADQDLYALSIMVQWLWRSAIRDGGEIWVYMPSRRMRTLLQNWIDSLTTEGGEADAGPV